MRSFSAIALLILLAASVSVMFLDDKWVTSIPEVVSFLLAAAWMIAAATGAARPVLSPVLAPLALIVLWGVIQTASGVTVYRWNTWLSVLFWLGNASISFVAIQAFSEDRIRDRFLRSLVVFGFAVTVLSSLQALTDNTKIYWTFPTRFAGWVLMGPFVYHNQYAAFIELILPVGLFKAATDKSWRWFYLLVSATMYASILISGSRAGFVLTTLEILIVPLVVARRRSISWSTSAGAAAVLVCMVVLLCLAAGPDYLLQRFRIKDPYSIRREFVLSSVRMFRDRPLTGFGLGNWATAYPAYAVFDDGLYANQAHNDWAQWAVEGGLPMILIMLGTAFWITPRAVRSGWGCGVAAVFLHCIVDYPIQRQAVAVLLFILVGAVSCVRSPETHKRENRSPVRSAIRTVA